MKNETNQLYLYDPRYNLKIPTSYDELINSNISSKRYIKECKKNMKKLFKINKYIIDSYTTQNDIRKMYEDEVYPNELWRRVEEADDECYISNYGRFKKPLKNGNDKLILPYRKLHQRKEAAKKYSYVKIIKNGKMIEVRISNLVAKAFLEIPQGDIKDYRVYHKDGILHNDFVGNLEWVSQSELAKITGGKAKSISILQLDPITYEEIDSFKSAREAGRQLYISRQTVSDIASLKASCSINGEVFVKEDEYYVFMDTLQSKPYIMYNAKTKEKFKGTLPQISEKYNIDIHKLRCSFTNKKNVYYTNYYVVGPNKKNFDDLKFIKFGGSIND